MRAIAAGVFLMISAPGSLALAQNPAGAPLSPNQGNVIVTGQVEDTNGNTGTFEVKAVLRDGNFAGNARVSIGDEVLEGPLYTARSYLENKRCMFYLESGRSRAELYGPCNSSSFGGQGGGFDSWFPGSGGHVGKLSGTVATGAVVAAAAGRLPSGKLLCSYQEYEVSFRAGEAGRLGQIVSMGALTLTPPGNYVTGTGNSAGRFTKTGNKLTFTSGPWAGAIGTLEPDRAGKPSLTIDKEESAANGRVLPQTTRCTSRG